MPKHIRKGTGKGNPKPVGYVNPNIAEHGKNTRFGSKNDPAKKCKPWSVREQLRAIAAAEIDITAPNASKAIEKLFGKKITIAQLAAIRTAQRVNLGSEAAIERLENAIDGPLPSINVNMNDDSEDDAEYAKAKANLMRRVIQATQSSGTGSDSQ